MWEGAQKNPSFSVQVSFSRWMIFFGKPPAFLIRSIDTKFSNMPAPACFVILVSFFKECLDSSRALWFFLFGEFLYVHLFTLFIAFKTKGWFEMRFQTMALFPNIASLDLNINRSGTLQFIQKVPILLSNTRKAPNLLASIGRLRLDSPSNYDG